jgi:hypothetical protein
VSHREVTVEQVRHALEHGCGDRSCRFVAPKGMATNGGCRCFDKLATHLLVGKLMLLVLELDDEVEARIVEAAGGG